MPDDDAAVPEPPTSSLQSPTSIVAYYRVVSGFIDLECRGRGDEPFWLGLVADRVTEVGRPRVLELGAGTGRITAMLARGAYHVVGIDISEDMLARARERVGPDPRVSLVATDMRRPGVAGGFDLVVAPNDPFAHLAVDAGRDAALRAAVERLRPGGRLVIDAHWLSADELALACDVGLERERLIGDAPDEILVREAWRCAADGRSCTASYAYHRGETKLAAASFEATLWAPDELERRLTALGLDVVGVWGDYERTAWDAATARHLVVEALRP